MQKIKQMLGGSTLAGWSAWACSETCTTKLWGSAAEQSGLAAGGLAGDEIEQLWHEYEEAATPEANLVKDFDKVCRNSMWALQV